MSTTTAEELKKVALSRLAEIIQSGASQDQAAYLAKAYEEITKAEANEKIVEALLLLPQYKESAEKAQKAAQDILNASEGLVKLGKPAVRLFGRVLSAWDKELLYCPPTGSNASKFTYNNLDWLKENFVRKTAVVLEVAPRNNFHFQLHLSSFGDNPPYLWSMYLLKNNSDEDKQVEITVKLSSRASGDEGAYVVANGNVLVSYTSNAIKTWSFTGDSAVTIPAGQGLLVFVQNAGYYQTKDGNNTVYLHRMVHNVDFVFPEGVDWDYEAYKELLS